MHDNRLGAYILNKRRELGLTQAQLAEQLGVHQTRVSLWERGARTPDTDQLKSLGAVFGVTVQEMLTEFMFDNPVERVLIQDPFLAPDDRNALLRIYMSLTRQAIKG